MLMVLFGLACTISLPSVLFGNFDCIFCELVGPLDLYGF